MARKSTVEKRRLLYPETDVYKFHNANPQDNFTGDCVARAISEVTGKPWSEVILEMTHHGIKKGLIFNDRKNIKSYLKSLGWEKHKEPRNRFNKKIKAKDFLRDNYLELAIVNLGSRHIAAVVNNQIIDTWNSSYETMHSYWTPTQ